MISRQDTKDMQFSMSLSLIVGVALLFAKCYAYFITGSSAILSDAAESVVHVVAVSFATYSMWLSLKPADENHLYGHDKIGFFSAGFEGAMIIFAALVIFKEAGQELIYGAELSHLGEGMLYIGGATLINLGLSTFLIQKGKKYNSIILEANGKHILTDVWTSFAVILALIAVKLTGWVWLDPTFAIIAAANILWTGSKLIRKSVKGLMDEADPALDQQITKLLDEESKRLGLSYHNLRHRLSGHRVFIELDLVFPENLSLTKAHEAATEIEKKLKDALPYNVIIYSHLEPENGHA